MRRWILTSAILGALLAFTGCEEEGQDEVDLDLGETPELRTEGSDETDTYEDIEETAESDVRPSAGAAQHPPPEQANLEPEELPDERVAGAAQHPLPESVRE